MTHPVRGAVRQTHTTPSGRRWACTLLGMRTLLLALVGIPLLGCSSGEPRAADSVAASPVPSATATADSTVRYQGRPTSDWLAQLADRDAETRRDASRALAAIGAPAVPGLVAILEDSADSRWMGAALAITSMCPEDAPAIRAASARARTPRMRGQLDTIARALVAPDSFPQVGDTGFAAEVHRTKCVMQRAP